VQGREGRRGMKEGNEGRKGGGKGMKEGNEGRE
jgi:hypothetical protein